MRPGRDGTLEHNAALLAHRRVQFDHAADQLRQVYLLARHGTGLGQCDAQQRIQGAAHAIDFDGHLLEHAPLGRPVGQRAHGPLRAGLQAIQRRAQVMGGAVKHGTHAESQLLDLIEHGVDLARQGVDLIVGVPDR